MENDGDYQGSHKAPDKNDARMDKITDVYPDDIYSSLAARYYGDSSDDYSDQFAISIIQAAKNKPNLRVKIYRAVPELASDLKTQISKYGYVYDYLMRFPFMPMNNPISDEVREKTGFDIPKNKEYLLDKLSALHKEYKEKTIKVINPGDWVTITKDYAKLHSKAHVGNFNKGKVLTKTVYAKDLYTDGNSIHEWGYNP